jgi:hypothetical protein
MRLYVIERRNPDGSLDLKGRQPESIFGLPAIQGISEDAIAKIVYRHKPDVVLDGRYLANWAAEIDPSWHTRVKTW